MLSVLPDPHLQEYQINPHQLVRKENLDYRIPCPGILRNFLRFSPD